MYLHFLFYSASLLVLTMGARAAEADNSEAESGILLREVFADLENWRTWEFPKVDRATTYQTGKDEGEPVLRMEAKESASGLILIRNFPTSKKIRLRWRWRADVLPDVSDPSRREGDDFAIRVYVIFEQDASEAGWLERWALRNSPFRDEGVLPENSLAYAWSDQAELPEFYPNPYTDRVAVFPIHLPPEALGQWREVQVDPIRDYRRAFGRDPPRYFRLALMSDADDSRSQAVAWMNFLEIRQD